MPFYSYECTTCGVQFELFQKSMISAEEEKAPDCGHCPDGLMKRLVSRIAVLSNASSGIGQAAYPTSWSDVNNGDMETIKYWRERVEREKSEEASDPGLATERLENANERYNRISQGLESKDSSSKGSTLNPNEVTTQHTFNPSGHVHGPGGHTH
jgi:putative FmdB family regulatory protein